MKRCSLNQESTLQLPRIGVSSIGVLCLVALTKAFSVADPYNRGALSIFSEEDAGSRAQYLRRSLHNNVQQYQTGVGDSWNSTHTAEDYSSEISSDDLAVVVTFEDILRLTVFIAAAWIMSNFSMAIGLPGLVGEIITGFLLGPPLADLCPFPKAMVLVGNFGLLGLMLESGIHLDVAQLRETGTRAVLMALCGTLLALLTGLGLGFIPGSGGSDFASSLAVGACFAPSSLGVAAAVLSSGEVLNTPIGQLIVASSVVDDVLGLILLAILNVFVTEDPRPFDFVQPFLASFGFLIFLGYLGITWIPHIIQHVILPKLASHHHEKATFAIMFGLMLVYLPLLNYSGASYLTGAFLAGLSVSQLPAIHTSYSRNGRELMVWLMRIFFTATIGFQVPIMMYNNAHVFKWSAKFLAPVVAKAPLGLLVPRFRKEVPRDFPFDPYWRDMIVTSLSVVCRGEFNFVVASFALSNGLLDPRIYSAIVMAVLISSILGPLLLSATIRHYNRLARDYLAMPHQLEPVDKSNKDGSHPLFIAIQIRTPISWNLHERFQNILDGLGLLVLDHRTWHTNGLEAVAMTEIFVQDSVKTVTIKNCFSMSTRNDVETSCAPKVDTILDDTESGDEGAVPAGKISSALGGTDRTIGTSMGMSASASNGEDDSILHRLNEIKVALESCLGDNTDDKYAIKTTQWEPFLQEPVVKGHHRQRTYTFHETLSMDEKGGTGAAEDVAEDLPEGDDRPGYPQSSGSVRQEQNLPMDTPPAPRSILERKRAYSYGERLARHESISSEFRKVRSVSHDHLSTTPDCDCSRDGADTSRHHPSPSNERNTHHRRRSSSGLCDGYFIGTELWETDRVSHQCVRRGSCIFQPCVAGFVTSESNGMGENHYGTYADGLYHRDVYSPEDHTPLEAGQISNSSHNRRESMDAGASDQETSAIHHMLHGYIRH